MGSGAGTTTLTTDAASCDARVRSLVGGLRSQWVRLAAALSAFHAMEGWAVLGCDSFEQWLADPEIDIGRRHAYQLIESWRVLVVGRNVEPAELAQASASKVAQIVPAVRSERVEPSEALADAQTLSRSDLREKYRHDHGAPLDAAQESVWAICQSCGSRYRVSG